MVPVPQGGPGLPKKPQVRRQNRRDPDELRSTYQQSYWYDTALKWNRLANQDRPADERESMTQTIDRIIDMLHQCGDHFAVTRYRGARSLAQHELELGGSEGLGL
jgi:hypothetical protein